MALDVYVREDISSSIKAGITMAAMQPDPVLLAGALIAFRHQAFSFGLNWQEVIKEVAQSLPPTVVDNLLAVERGRVLEQLDS